MTDQPDQPDQPDQSNQPDQPDEAAARPGDEVAGTPTEGAQAAEKPEAGEVEEAAGAVEEPDAEGEGGGAAADAPADTKAEKPQDGGRVAEDKSAEDTAGGDTSQEPAQETLHGHPLVDSLGCAVVHTDREGYLELCQALAADGYNLFLGLTCVDYLVHPGRQLAPGVTPERFEVVVELASVSTRRRVRIRCQVPGAEPTLPTLFDVWPGSEAHEREAYDMFGIVFEGHPDPSRILMPEDWEGHPLRKDYATGRIPVQFKESPGGR